MKTLALLACFSLFLPSMILAMHAAEESLIPPDSPLISTSDFVNLDQVNDPKSPTGKTARFDRLLDMPGKGYRWDNPGTRIAFRTDADRIEVFLSFSDRHRSTSARNAIGRYWIDGVSHPDWMFCTTQTAVQRTPENITLVLTSPASGSFHHYELILPYADAVEFQGLRLPEKARLENPPNQKKPRYLAYGDSITQGFTASEASRTYAFLLAQKKGWQLLNMGFGGRSSTSSDGAILSSCNPDIVTVLMGVNDWQGGTPVAIYQARMNDFLSGLRAGKPTVPIYLITPLWVSPSWKPEKAMVDLEEYRAALRALLASRSDPQLHLIEGSELIDHDPSLFDPVAVHPNDRGFLQMSERLDKALSLEKLSIKQ